MKAVNGYIENGRFMPLELLKMPKRTPAVLVFEEVAEDVDRQARVSWLKQFHMTVKQATDEETPDFPRLHFGRMPVDLSDEGDQ